MIYLLDTNACIVYLNRRVSSVRHRLECLSPQDTEQVLTALGGGGEQIVVSHWQRYRLQEIKLALPLEGKLKTQLPSHFFNTG